MNDEQVLKLLHKPMKYLSSTFAYSIKDVLDSHRDLYHDLIVLYYERKNKPKAKQVRKKSQKDISYYWFIIFRNYLLDRYRRYVGYTKVKDKLQGVLYDKYLEDLYFEEDIIL